METKVEEVKAVEPTKEGKKQVNLLELLLDILKDRSGEKKAKLVEAMA
jgi:hypothetical protein